MTMTERPQVAETPFPSSLAALVSSPARWCLLRPPRDRDDDVDLLVDPADLTQVLAQLRDLGFVEEPGYGRGTHRFLVGLHNGVFTRVDLVTSLDFGPLHTWRSGMARTCLARSTRVGGVPRLQPVDEFWVTALHLLADDGARVTERRRWAEVPELSHLPASEPGHDDWHAAVDRLLPARELHVALAGALTDLAGGADRADDLTRMRQTVRRCCLTAAARHRGPALGMVQSVWLRATEPARQWRGRRGLLVAVLGPDGAGKSTLLERLGRSWAWPHQRIYFGLWPDVRGGGRLAPALWPLRRPFRALTRYARGVVGSWRGRLVLFDRYVYDAAVPPRGSHRTLKRLYFQVLLHCAPAPDLVLLLEAPGELLFARKGEMDPATLDAHREAVSRHVHRLAGRSRRRPTVVVVDATRSPRKVADQAVEAVWSLAAARLDRRGRTS